MGRYQGNAEEVLHIIFPGSLVEGEKAPPSLREIQEFSRVLERIVNSADFHETGWYGSEFRLVGADVGSLEIWLQLVQLSQSVVATLSDGPGAIRTLLGALERLKDSGGGPNFFQKAEMTADEQRSAVQMVDDLRRSVKSAGSITISHQEWSITLTEVDFRNAEEAERGDKYRKMPRQTERKGRRKRR